MTGVLIPVVKMFCSGKRDSSGISILRSLLMRKRQASLNESSRFFSLRKDSSNSLRRGRCPSEILTKHFPHNPSWLQSILRGIPAFWMASERRVFSSTIIFFLKGDILMLNFWGISFSVYKIFMAFYKKFCKEEKTNELSFSKLNLKKSDWILRSLLCLGI